MKPTDKADNTGVDTAARPDRRLTRLDAFLQIFCVAQGESFFLAPAYLRDVGIVPGIVSGCLSTAFYLYIARVYFWCEKQLREQDPSTVESVTTIDVLVERIFVKIARWPTIGRYMNMYVKLAVILCWTIGLSFAILFVAKNLQLILRNVTGETRSDLETMSYVAIPLVFFAFAPNLEALNKALYLSSVCVLLIMAETFYYTFATATATAADEYPKLKINLFGSLGAIPTYVNNVQISIANPPLLFLYKSEMIREKDLTSPLGSLNTALFSTTILVVVYATACNIRFGDQLTRNIIGNLPNNLLINVSNILMTVNLILVLPIHFYGLFSYVRSVGLGDRIHNSVISKTFEYAVRIGQVLVVATIALFVPCLSTLINLSGCFTTINDVVTLPLVLEVVIVWKCASSDRKRLLYVLCKNGVIISLSTAYCVWSLIESVRQYHPE